MRLPRRRVRGYDRHVGVRIEPVAATAHRAHDVAVRGEPPSQSLQVDVDRAFVDRFAVGFAEQRGEQSLAIMHLALMLDEEGQ